MTSEAEKILKYAEEAKKEKERENRKKVLNYYKRKVPLYFLATIGGITIVGILINYWTKAFDNLEGAIFVVVIIYAFILLVAFIRDMANPSDFTE